MPIVSYLRGGDGRALQPGNQQIFRVGIAEDHSRPAGRRNYRQVVASLLVHQRLRLPGFGVAFLRSLYTRTPGSEVRPFNTAAVCGRRGAVFHSPGILPAHAQKCLRPMNVW